MSLIYGNKFIDDFVEQLEGAGMTQEQSNQLQALYDKLINVDDGKRTLIYLGSGNSYNLNNYEGYQDFTEDNFLIEIISCGIGGWVNASGNPSISCTVTKTYDKTTGDLSITKISGVWNNYESNGLNHGSITLSVKYNVYLIY